MRKAIVTASAVVLALAITPALAQQKSKANDRAMERANALEKKVIAGFNNKDAAAVAALYTADAVFVGVDGAAVTGPAAIQAVDAGTIKAWGNNFKYTAVVKEARPLGNAIWTVVDARTEINGTATTSHVFNIFVPQGKDWKILATSVGRNAPPPGSPPAR